jgi:hypothetical protein
MSQRDDHWSAEDEDVVRRLRDGKPHISAHELDSIKTTVMARVRPSTARRGAPRSRFVVALLTLGLMVAGTAGTLAASNGGTASGGTGAAKSEYHPHKCRPIGGGKWVCKCPKGAAHTDNGSCICPNGETLLEGSKDACVCPDGSTPDATECHIHRHHGPPAVVATPLPSAPAQSTSRPPAQSTSSSLAKSTSSVPVRSSGSTVQSSSSIARKHAHKTKKRTRHHLKKSAHPAVRR